MTAAWTVKQLKADNDSLTEETTTGFAGLAPDGAEDYTAIAAKDGAMQEVAQGRQVDEAQVPSGANSVSVQGSAGTSVSLAAPSLGTTTLNGGIILPKCTRHSLDSYYATDHLGTVRFVKTVDEAGTEVATTTHDYEPFGVEITPTDACDNTHKFTGHERDTETGNDYMHFRFFSASMGRFQKPDSNFDSPLANPQGWNLYSYVKGNPVNFNDPTGHMYRVAGENAGGRSNNPMPFSSPFVEPSVDLDDYLWGGADIYETVTRYTVSQGGSVVDWGYQAPGQVAPSFVTGKTAEYWLETVVGVPKDKVAGVLKQLHDVYKVVGMGPELAVVIARDAKGNYGVFDWPGGGDNGATRSEDIDKAKLFAGGNGYTTVVAAGHAHPFTGSHATITGGKPQAEGASRADAAGYAQDINRWVTNPGALFVLTTGTIFSFNSPPIPDAKNPGDPFTFSRYSW